MKTTLYVLKRSRSVCYVWINKEIFRILKYNESKKHKRKGKMEYEKGKGNHN